MVERKIKTLSCRIKKKILLFVKKNMKSLQEYKAYIWISLEVFICESIYIQMCK